MFHSVEVLVLRAAQGGGGIPTMQVLLSLVSIEFHMSLLLSHNFDQPGDSNGPGEAGAGRLQQGGGFAPLRHQYSIPGDA